MYQRFMKKVNRAKKMFFLLVSAIFALPVLGEQVDENTARQIANQKLLQSTSTHNENAATQSRATIAPQKTVQLLYKSSSKSENANSTMPSARTNTDETVYFLVNG